MEIIDIIDKKNQVLYQCSKEEAHQKGLLHACIIAEVIDSKGNWTLVKQANNRQDAGQYVSPVGGHIRAGENVTDALARETLEEIGLTNFSSKFIGKAILNREVIGRKENHLFILYEIYSDQIPTLNHESVSFEKFTPAQIKQEILSNPTKFGQAFHFVLENFYEQLID
ncbi:NUDIX hydrolase [Candidatus Woesebacteria bacterium]|nr:NUDIX hydrolase [Candidatus Woesebacteria bacterium]